MGSFYTLSAFRALPKPVKKWQSGLNVVYDSVPNISIPTTMPSTPLLTIALTPPTETGDEPYQKRYAAGIVLNVHNGSGSTATVTVRIRVGEKTLEASGDVSAGYYGNWHGLVYYTPPSNLEVYAQASVSGCSINKTVVATLLLHVFSYHACTSFVYSISRYEALGSTGGASEKILYPIRMQHDELVETTHSDTARVRVSGALRPNLYTTEFLTLYWTYSSLGQRVVFLYPSLVLWGEV